MSNDTHITTEKQINIYILGASFETGNMGVSALAESAVMCLKERWPGARVDFLSGGRTITRHSLQYGDQEITVSNLPIRNSKNIFLQNHILKLLMYALLFRIIPNKKFISFFKKRNNYLRQILNCSLVADITGGDSFSDIYGMTRFIMGFLRKWLVVLYKKPLFFLPQTYGPFRRKITKKIATFILRRSQIIYSRDQDGIDYLQTILAKKTMDSKVHLIPDVAFSLRPGEPKEMDLGGFPLQQKNTIRIGLNISGLLYNECINQENTFGLSINYEELLTGIIHYFMSQKNTVMLLIPHVFPPKKFIKENDSYAIEQIYTSLSKQYPDRLFYCNGRYNQREIKYIIGLTDFFLGARMHACIAALSQHIPTIGMAYSKKFNGVFDTIGMADNVADMMSSTKEEIITCIEHSFTNRENIHNQLKVTVTKAKQNISGMFDSVEL